MDLDLEIFFNILLALLVVTVTGAFMGFFAYFYIFMFDLILSYAAG